MKCSRCFEEAVIFQKESGASLCARHLAADIESRAKKEIRNKGGIRSGERIFIAETRPVQTFALRIFLSALFLKRRDIVFLNEASGASLVMTDKCLDDAAAEMLDAVISGTVSSYPGAAHAKPRTLSPLAVIPEKEIFLYAQMHGWKQELLPASGAVRRFLNDFSEDRPSAKFALKKIADKLGEIENAV